MVEQRQNTLGRRVEGDTPTSNEGLLPRENGENASTLDKSTMSKRTPVSPAHGGVKKVGGPQYTKNGVNCSVAMLDGHDVTIEVSKVAKGQELIDKVCSNLQLLEKDYFSCSFMVNGIRFWLSHNKRISKQIKSGPWNFKFEVKFYPTEPTIMSEDLTRYQLFLQLRRDVFSGKLPCSFLTYALLGSFASQSEFGDHDEEEVGQGIQYLKESAPFAPNQTDEMLERISEYHKSHRGQNPSEAEANYLDNAKLLALYGVDLHKAKDSDDREVNIGVNASGLTIYRDRLRIHRFPWAKILKIAYKRNNFMVKTRKYENSPSEQTAMTFKLQNYTMAKRLWKTSVEHHTFFRLKEPEPVQRAMFPLFGSKFRYSGRTQYQTNNAASHIDRKTPTIDRAASRRYQAAGAKQYGAGAAGAYRAGSEPFLSFGPGYSTERVEEVIVPGEGHMNTLDLKNRRKNKQGGGGMNTLGTNGLPGNGRDVDNLDPNYDGHVSLGGGLNNSTASYQRQLNGSGMAANPSGGGGGGGGTPRFDKYGQPIVLPRGHEGPYNGAKGSAVIDSKVGEVDEDDMPPYQEDQHLLKNMTGGGPGGQYNPYNQGGISSSTTRTTTRTYRGPDGTMITEHKVEKDGVIETRIEKKTTLVDSPDDDFDHDKALHDAIFAVTEMNPDLSVEKIEIRTEREQK